MGAAFTTQRSRLLLEDFQFVKSKGKVFGYNLLLYLANCSKTQRQRNCYTSF